MNTLSFIDASNLFYGGEKSLGWKIDYQKLLKYLQDKYQVSTALYFGGVEIYDFKHDYLKNETVTLTELKKHLEEFIKVKGYKISEPMLILLNRHLQKIRFYLRLESFGYQLYLKPVKRYQNNDITKKKANCDADMVFYLMKEKDNFDRVIILSGDGDFLPVLKYLKSQNKEVVILARGPRTAREIRQFAGSNFRDFVKLENRIKFIEK